MPASSLGDRRAVIAPTKTGTVVVSIDDGSRAPRCAYPQVLSVLACILLVASGVSVGVWAATNS